MRTERQIEASRINGAKSRGPVTPEGRARSSQNAVKHGLTGRSAAVLDSESHEEFNHHLSQYFDRFDPADPVECDLVGVMVNCQWRLRRYFGIETSLLEHHMDLRAPELSRTHGRDVSNHTRVALAFKDLADNSNALQLLNRYEGRLRREFDRSLNMLIRLQEQRKSTAAVAATPEVQLEQEPEVQPEQQIEATPSPEIKNAKRTQAVPGAEEILPLLGVDGGFAGTNISRQHPPNPSEEAKLMQ